MPRIDVPEIEDQSWFPAWLRNPMTGYLQTVIEVARPYDCAVAPLRSLLAGRSEASVVDLASGAGGPWAQLAPALREHHPELRVLLTDIAPNLEAAGQMSVLDGIEYHRDPVSAMDVPPLLDGVRTMFTGLHHFSPDQVRSIMRAAQRDRVPFAAFEATQRSVAGGLVSLFIPLMVLVLMPRVRPRRFLTLLLTYLPPILPILIWWDGFASTLRTYSVDELEGFAREVAEPGYDWSATEIAVKGSPIPVLQLVGTPSAL